MLKPNSPDTKRMYSLPHSFEFRILVLVKWAHLSAGAFGFPCWQKSQLNPRKESEMVHSIVNMYSGNLMAVVGTMCRLPGCSTCDRGFSFCTDHITMTNLSHKNTWTTQLICKPLPVLIDFTFKKYCKLRNSWKYEVASNNVLLNGLTTFFQNASLTPFFAEMDLVYTVIGDLPPYHHRSRMLISKVNRILSICLFNVSSHNSKNVLIGEQKSSVAGFQAKKCIWFQLAFLLQRCRM